MNGRDEALGQCGELAQDDRVPRRPIECLIGQHDEIGRMEAAAQPLQAQRGDPPIAVAPSAAEQIELLGQAFHEG